MSSDDEYYERTVGLIHLEEHDSLIVDLLPSNEGRSSITNRLLAYYFIQHQPTNDDDNDDNGVELEIVPYKLGTRKDLCMYHDPLFVDLLLLDRSGSIDDHINPLSSAQAKILEKLGTYKNKFVVDNNNNSSSSNDSHASFDVGSLEMSGLSHDCPIFPRLDEYTRVISGTTLSITKWIIEQFKLDPERQLIGLSWSGGRHHSHKSKASGFCYVNDINLSILRLRRCFNRVTYLDLDLHHGDGVCDAFKFSDKVMTFSIHRFDEKVAFFPGSGGEYADTNRNNDFNVPLRKGLSDTKLMWIIENIFLPRLTAFQGDGDVLVIQCGGDGLCSDTAFKNEWNLSIKGYGLAIKRILDRVKMPCILLGGGGYNNLETAKLWTYLTGVALRMDHRFEPGQEFEELPSFQDCYSALDLDEEILFWQNDTPSNLPDLNDLQYLSLINDVINEPIK